MRIEVIKEKLNNILANYNFSIYSVREKKEFGEKILEILIKGQNINIDTLEEIHLSLYENLSEGDLPDNYFLELSSMGAEYPLSTIEDIKEHLGVYVYVRTKKFELLGTIISVDGLEITFEYNAKGQYRKMKIEYDEIVEITTRVKL